MWSEYESKTSKEHQKKVQSWGKSTLWVNVRPAVLISKYVPGMCLRYIYIYLELPYPKKKKGFCPVTHFLPGSGNHRYIYIHTDMMYCMFFHATWPSLQLWAAQLPSFVDFIPTFGWWYVALAVHPTMLDAQLTGTCHVKTVRGPLEFQTRIWIHLLAHHKKQTNLRFVLKENTKNAIFLDESVYSIFVQMPHVFLPSISCSLVMSSCFLPICVFKFQFLSANNGDTNHLSGECLTSRSIVHLYVFPLKFPGSH